MIRQIIKGGQKEVIKIVHISIIQNNVVFTLEVMTLMCVLHLIDIEKKPVMSYIILIRQWRRLKKPSWNIFRTIKVNIKKFLKILTLGGFGGFLYLPSLFPKD